MSIPIDAIADKLEEAADVFLDSAERYGNLSRNFESINSTAHARIFLSMASILRDARKSETVMAAAKAGFFCDPGSERLPAQDDPAERLPAKDEPVTSEADYVRSRGWRHG